MSSTASPSSARPDGPDTTPPDGVAALSGVGALVARLDALLPQTQCTRCGYPDCRAYATALARGEAGIDRCPPGGAEGVRRLAAALGRAPRPLDPECGAEGPRRTVYIDERACIGCTLCIQACPVDAIIGAPKRMHAVVEAECTGCELCLPACPVDCLVVEDATPGTGWDAWSQERAERARVRYARRAARLAADARARAERLAATAAAREARVAPVEPETAAPEVGAASDAVPPTPVDPKRAAIEAALARARLRARMRTP
ncbi:MAG: electron transport complex subunit RsxB [Burkholderiaceae bacterium]